MPCNHDHPHEPPPFTQHDLRVLIELYMQPGAPGSDGTIESVAICQWLEEHAPGPREGCYLLCMLSHTVADTAGLKPRDADDLVTMRVVGAEAPWALATAVRMVTAAANDDRQMVLALAMTATPHPDDADALPDPQPFISTLCMMLRLVYYAAQRPGSGVLAIPHFTTRGGGDGE